MHTWTHTRIRVHYCLLREQLIFSPQFVLNPRDRYFNSQLASVFLFGTNKINSTQASKQDGWLPTDLYCLELGEQIKYHVLTLTQTLI